MPTNIKVFGAKDFLHVTPEGQVHILAQALLKHRGTFARRTAILCPFEKFDRATFFAMCAEQHGFNIQAFTSYQEAMERLLAPGQA